MSDIRDRAEEEYRDVILGGWVHKSADVRIDELLRVACYAIANLEAANKRIAALEAQIRDDGR